MQLLTHPIWWFLEIAESPIARLIAFFCKKVKASSCLWKVIVRHLPVGGKEGELVEKVSAIEARPCCAIPLTPPRCVRGRQLAVTGS